MLRKNSNPKVIDKFNVAHVQAHAALACPCKNMTIQHEPESLASCIFDLLTVRKDRNVLVR